jgi:squalene synthase HpnC
MTAPTRTEKSENFPVASWLLKPATRAPVLAFYRFARQADDIADDAGQSPGQRLGQLRDMAATLAGDSDADPVTAGLRAILAARGLGTTHAHDLLAAFTRDVATPRTATYADLIAYCEKSAMPVGRFVCDVHGEDRAVWAASDALCAALQIINHLQDCGKDFRDMGRVYIPDDMLHAAGLDIDILGQDRSPPALLGVIRDLAARCERLLAESRPFAAMLGDRRLAAEVRVIQRLAEDLTRLLLVRDPLAERVEHSNGRRAWLAACAVAGL